MPNSGKWSPDSFFCAIKIFIIWIMKMIQRLVLIPAYKFPEYKNSGPDELVHIFTMIWIEWRQILASHTFGPVIIKSRPDPEPSARSPSPDLNKNLLRSIDMIQDIISKWFLGMYTMVIFWIYTLPYTLRCEKKDF